MRIWTRALVVALILVVSMVGTVSAHWPVANRYARVSQWYGCTGLYLLPRYGSCAHWHSGIDIVAPYGTAILSVAYGTVAYTGYNYSGGWEIIIKHPYGNLYTIYGHLSRIYVRRGQHVLTGQTIGRLGASGRVTGAHLHISTWYGYPYRYGSHMMNPWRYINHGSWLPYRYR